MLNKLKSDYEELEIKPSSDLWDRLEGKLDKKAEIVLKPSFQWWKYAAVIAVLISLGTLFYFDSSQEAKISVVENIQKTPENVLKPIEKHSQTIVLNQNRIKNEMYSKPDKNNIRSDYSLEKTSEKIEHSQDIVVTEKENIITKVPVILAEKQENSLQPLVADRKKVSYISADDLLVGRELDKTREENYNDQRKFGVINMSKIKIKGPNSLKILGFTVISDSVKTK